MKKKRRNNSIHGILRIAISVLAVILAALLIRKGYTMYQDREERQQLKVRNQEVQSEVDDIRLKIKELSGDGEALKAFLDEQKNHALEKKQNNVTEEETIPKAPVSADEVAEEITEEIEETDSDAIIIDEPEIPKTQPQEDSISDNRAGDLEQESEQEDLVSGNQLKEEEAEEDDTVSGNQMDETTEDDTVSGNRLDGNTEEDIVSGNQTAEAVPGQDGGTISGNAIVDGKVIPFYYTSSELTLEERRNLSPSYEETIRINNEDKAKIAANTVDFSGRKIACLGDSITAGSNLSDLDNYQQYSYPSALKNTLNAKDVYNLGIGGSSIGRYWDKPFVERYKDIPQDSDVIIVMGGTNDGFAASAKELGNIEERKPRTFYGDVNELMGGLKKNYPNAVIVFATPLPNILHDYLMYERDYLMPQSVFADAVKALAPEYGIDVIDLYNSNLLDTHDTQVISALMPDGVHGNEEGYKILAEHFASELIDIMERRIVEGSTVSGNSVEEETVSGNSADVIPVSGNDTPENSVPADKEEEQEPEESAEERAARIKKEQENKKKVAEDALIIKEEPPENTQKKESDSGADSREKDYKYDGEAIIVN